MNIKQIEEKSGMPRANIRYYEQQGLLTPARAGNNYRDYSGEDLTTLARIRLLRQLGLSVETIRRLQSGEESLPDVLAARMDELAAGAAAAETARTVCAALRADGADYATLDAEKYLAEADRLAAQARAACPAPARPAPALEMQAEPAAAGQADTQPETTVFRTARPVLPPVPEGWQPAGGHPWRRYLARQLDLALYAALLYLIAHRLLRCFPPQGQPLEWAWGAFCPMLMMAVLEPLLLARFATTPGKWLMGLRLEQHDGMRFSYGEGWLRTWGVLISGLGLGIPLVAQWRLYRSWRGEQDGRGGSWEEAGERYLLRDESGWRIPVNLAAQAVLIVCGVAWMLNGYLPAAHGRAGVTPEQFAANFNSYRSYADGYYNVTERLQPDGSWEPTGNGAAVVFDINGEEAARPDAPFVIETDAAGLVARVSYAWEDTAGGVYAAAPASTVLYAMYSFAGAQPGASALAILAGDEAYRTVVGSGLTGFSLESNGIRITYTVECRGYQLPVSGGWPYAIREDDAGPDAGLRGFLCMEKLPAA